jgi:hypothetical protein
MAARQLICMSENLRDRISPTVHFYAENLEKGL